MAAGYELGPFGVVLQQVDSLLQRRALGHSIGAIAQAIGRPKSTVSRELSRNRLPSGRYSPLHAAGAYQLRRQRKALIERDRALRTFIVDRLAEGWTPVHLSYEWRA